MKDTVLKYLGLGRASDYPDSDAKQVPWWVFSLLVLVGIAINKVFFHDGFVSMVLLGAGCGVLGGLAVAAVLRRRAKPSDPG